MSRIKDAVRVRGSWLAMLLVLVVAAAACAGDGGTDEEDATGAEDAAADDGAAEEATAADDADGGDVDTEALEEVTWDMASFLGPDTGQGRAYTRWIEEIQDRSGGAVTVNPFWNSELLGPQEIATGLRDGRIQMGNLTYAYTPSDFPLTQMVEVPFLGNNLAAQVTAMNALYEENEQFRAEWEDQGIKVLSFVPIAASLTGAEEQIDSVGWFDGRTVRASGFYVKALEAVGANPAAIPVGETYEAMQRGTVDAYGGLILDVIPSTGLHEVGPHIHDAGLGHYAITTWGMAMDVYESLSPELRTLVDEVSAEFPQWVVETTSEAEDEACQTILDEGGSVSAWSEEATAEWREAIGETPRQDWIDLATEAGTEDAEAMYDQYVSLFEEAASGEFSDYQTGVERCIAVQES